MQNAITPKPEPVIQADVDLDPARAAITGARRSPRDVTDHIGGAPNALRFWHRARTADGRLLSALRISRNFAVIEIMKYFPSFALKRLILRALGMKLGRNVTIAPGVTLDCFFPELIEVGDNTIIGLNSTIITHEFLHDRYRSGSVRIGANVLLGAQSLVLAGVSIGDNATVSAGCFVNRNVPAGAFVRGNPMQIVRIDSGA